MSRIMNELFLRRHHLTWRAEYLAAVAALGSMATAVIVAVALIASREPGVAAIAATPATAVVVAGAWAALVVLRSRAVDRRIAAVLAAADGVMATGAGGAANGAPDDLGDRPPAGDAGEVPVAAT